MVTKAKKNYKTIKKKIMDLDSNIYFYLICAVIFFSPLFRGLFFEREFLVVHVLTFVIIFVWLYTKKNNRDYMLFRYKFEYFLFAVVGMYFLVIPFAANSRAALSEAMKYANYLAVYVLIREQIREDKKNIEILLDVLVFSMLVISVIGLFNYFGVYSTNGGLHGNRIASTVQYPNTLAALLAAGVYISLGKAQRGGHKVAFLYSFCAAVMTITFILTFSRAMWLLFPIGIFVQLLLNPSKQRFEYILLSLAVIILSALTAFKMVSYYGTRSVYAWVILIAATVFSAFLTFILKKYKHRYPEFTLKRVLTLTGVLVLVILAGSVIIINMSEPLELSRIRLEDGYIQAAKDLFNVEPDKEYILKLNIEATGKGDKPWLGNIVIYNIDKSWNPKIIQNYYIKDEVDGEIEVPFTTLENTYYARLKVGNYYKDTSITIEGGTVVDKASGKVIEKLKFKNKFIPENLMDRISQINLKTRSFQQRLVFYKDALKIIRDYPILGLGGGGWENIYYKYRSYEYWSTQAHSYPLQVWIDIGTFGIALLLIAFVMLAKRVFCTIKQQQDIENLSMVSSIAASIVVILMHGSMDFDLAYGSVCLILWALIALINGFGAEEVLYKKNARLRMLTLFCTLILILVSSSISIGAVYAHKADAAIDKGEYDKAKGLLNRALFYDPLNARYKVVYGNLLLRSGLKNTGELELARKQYEEAVKKDPFDTDAYSYKARFHYMVGEYEEARDCVNKFVELNPAVEKSYLQKADFLYNISLRYYKSGNKKQAEEYLKLVKGIKDDIINQNKRLIGNMQVSDELLRYISRADYIIEKIKSRNEFPYNVANRIVLYDKFEVDLDEDGLPELWNMPVTYEMVVEGKIVKEKGESVLILKSSTPSFWTRRSGLFLEPSSRYFIAIEAKSKSPGAKMAVVLGSNSGKREQFKAQGIELNDGYSIYQDTFETTEDIEPGKQYIQMLFNDKDGEIALKNIIVIELD